MERANGACKAEEPYKRNTELAVLASRGDEEACAELVEMNMGLVRGAAQRFSGRGTETEDLIQLGCIGLIKAARSFDAEKGCAFSTYAVPLILGEIKRHLRDNGQMKVSRSIKKPVRSCCGKVSVIMPKRVGRQGFRSSPKDAV